MKNISFMIMTIVMFSGCGIKGDPMPPTKPFDWGREKQEEKKVEAERKSQEKSEKKAEKPGED